MILDVRYHRQPLARPQAEDIVVGDLVRQHAAGQRAAALDLALGTLTRGISSLDIVDTILD